MIDRNKLFELLDVDPTFVQRVQWDVRWGYIEVEYLLPYDHGKRGGIMKEIVKLPIAPYHSKGPTSV